MLANKSVPVGGYALDFLGKASKLPEYTAAYSPTVLKNVVSYEENVKAVLSKITLGEADAGIVYTTDAATVTDGSIGTLDIPDNLNTIASYPIAATKNAKNADLAKKFVDYVLWAGWAADPGEIWLHPHHRQRDGCRAQPPRRWRSAGWSIRR